MPYIDKTVRKGLDIHIKNLVDVLVSEGELNYAISMLCKGHLEHKGESYKTYNEIIGVLECARLEFYRRKVAPYEDIKKEKNTDVY